MLPLMERTIQLLMLLNKIKFMLVKSTNSCKTPNNHGLLPTLIFSTTPLTMEDQLICLPSIMKPKTTLEKET